MPKYLNFEPTYQTERFTSSCLFKKKITKPISESLTSELHKFFTIHKFSDLNHNHKNLLLDLVEFTGINLVERYKQATNTKAKEFFGLFSE